MNRGPLSPLWSVLDRAAADGRMVDLWWRDDDAVRHVPALDRLLRLGAEYGCPVAIAAVPALVERSLIARLAGETSVTVLTHGFSHANHAPPGEKPAEIGPRRPRAEVEAELREAAARTRAAFGPQAAPVLVPPWNRIAEAHVSLLPRLGFRALSGFGRPVTARSTPGAVHRLDTHFDPVAWRSGRGLVPVEHLACAARLAIEGGTTALGLLTHHLMFDEALWRFLETFLEGAARHPALRLRRVGDLIAASGSSSPRLDPHACCGQSRAELEHAA